MDEELKDCEFRVGYDDYRWDTNDYVFFTTICDTFDNLKDAIKYRNEQEKRMPDKALWIQIVRKDNLKNENRNRS